MNKVAALVVSVASICAAPVWSQPDHCADFRRLIQTTYGFKPSKLSAKERDEKSTAMDKVWDAAKANPVTLAPCLRAALEGATADPWFSFDGANLLVIIDPSPASKELQVRGYKGVDLEDTDLQVWVETLADRGEEGFDVAEAGAKWLAHPNASYYLPSHGAFRVKAFQGALFILGSTDESQALASLLPIVGQLNHSGREKRCGF